MSKNRRENYDLTMDAVNDTLSRMDAFYSAHPMPENTSEEGDSVSMYFDVFIAEFVKGWKTREYTRHPFDYNHQMAVHSDRSPASLRNYYNKK